ncbi:MAG TPA: hypothetical protein VFK30_02760 [Anaerolineae bacterium]|nr:hypothetical protein [Anaerolineae bacterium]
MKPIVRLIAGAFILVLALIAVFGAFFGLIRCIVIAAVIGVIGLLLYRIFNRSTPPSSRQVIDQSPTPSEPQIDSSDIARQIEERKERLGK